MKKKIILYLAVLTNITVKAGINDVVLTSTNLPLIVIKTNGVDIPDGTKIDADMKIIYNGASELNHPADTGNIFSGIVGIEIRGSYSATFPQKSYSFETRDAKGNSLNVSILNMPAENDWILTGNYNDKSLMRNTLAYNLFERMGHYQPRTQLCEVILNNDYQGIYVLTEKIKRDKNRVDIARLDQDDNLGDSVTGGYIIKIDNTNYDGYDGWLSTYPALDRPDGYPYFVYVYPKPDSITSQQKAYIEGFINTLDSVLNSVDFADPVKGYRAYISVKSFIDYFIIGELSRNDDAYKKSSFFYKDKVKNDTKGLLHAGPVWDFDWAWKNIKECIVENTDGSGWAYEISSVCKSYPVPPGWVVKLLDDTTFANELKTRYVNLRKNLLSVKYLTEYIDSIQSLVNEAQVRHFTKWPILGVPGPAPEVEDDDLPTTYEGELDKLKDWIYTRLYWLDENMPGRYINTNIDNIIANKVTYSLFPNPAHEFIFFEAEKKMQQIEIFNSTGSKVISVKTGNVYSFKINTRGFHPGLYFSKVMVGENEIITSKFIIY